MKVYDRALTKYRQFLLTYSLPIELPSPPIVIALYATYMHQLEYAYRTIVTHMTAISHMHKYYQISEPTKNVFVQRTLQGIKQSSISVECRMPITLPLLHKLHISLNHIVSSPRARVMFQAMYLLAFHAFLRVGEMTQSHGRSLNVIQYHQISVTQDNYIVLSFSKYKHSKGRTHVISIQAQALPFCPVHTMREYIRYRGVVPSPLFIHADGRQVNRDCFTSMLNKTTKFLGLSSTFYKSHSFRIGAASHGARNGMSDAQIRHMGRWSSNAFKSYIRM